RHATGVDPIDDPVFLVIGHGGGNMRPSAYPIRIDRRSKRPGARPGSGLFAASLVAGHLRFRAGAPELALRLLLALALLLAVDAQGGDRPREQPLDADRLAAVLALVDGVRLQPIQGGEDLAEEV